MLFATAYKHVREKTLQNLKIYCEFASLVIPPQDDPIMACRIRFLFLSFLFLSALEFYSFLIILFFIFQIQCVQLDFKHCRRSEYCFEDGFD